jgi:hypothetical protein
MSDTNRHLPPRRSPASARPTNEAALAAPSQTPPARVEALRKLVAAGQYHVSAKWVAVRIFRAAGVPLPE